MNLSNKGRRKWCPLARIWFLHLAMELHLSNSNLPCDLLPLTTWHLVLHWDLLPTFYIMEPWALILHHVIRAIVFGEVLPLCILIFQWNNKTLGFKYEVLIFYGCGIILDHYFHFLLVVLCLLFPYACKRFVSVAILH